MWLLYILFVALDAFLLVSRTIDVLFQHSHRGTFKSSLKRHHLMTFEMGGPHKNSNI